jgi:hypothetical protein
VIGSSHCLKNPVGAARPARAVSNRKMDEDGAAHTLADFRRHFEGPPFANEDEDTAEFHKAVKFVGSHGQSFDWIFDGDPSNMICRLAARSNRGCGAPPPSRARPTLRLLEGGRSANS